MLNNHTPDLLSNAKNLQQKAYEVIANIGLIERWQQVGKPVVVGSIRFGLMASHNIDLEIYTDTPDIKAGFDIIKEIAETPGLEQIQYLNFMGTDDPGLYWHIFYRDSDGNVWDIDNWLVPNSHPHAGLADSLASAMANILTDDMRRTILQIKSQRPEGSTARGIDIYRAVIEAGITDYDQFQKWLEENQCEGIDTWRPVISN